MLANIANIAEIVGVTLVLVTLVFLTVQIRQNTRATRSTTIQAVMQSEMALAQILAGNADVWNKVLAGEALSDGEEMRRGIIVYNLFMIDAETRFHQFKSGFLDEQPWQATLRTLPPLVGLPIFAGWRESIGGIRHSKDFLDLIDEIHREATRA